ncbi:hypothetical protein CKO28_12315 [Rhodovibrio sodomensis]|uniref:Uncharacterized protein n=1 Tax=Rhodovibrio sodomensis TaxID=1088 RepID=A0ABS1DEG1_9PROT|nr:hypothetical protein [Rhodovibrio sodomensis]MBK1668815.1 hypothetical protein [Rhodovibrio sodomensis]
MNVQDTLTRLKPVVAGAIGGIVVAAIVAFSLNWVYTAGAMAENVHQAKVQTLAQVCEANAEKFWTQTKNMKMAKLEGWDNENRSELAKQFTPQLPNDASFHEDVVDACDDALQPA